MTDISRNFYLAGHEPREALETLKAAVECEHSEQREEAIIEFAKLDKFETELSPFTHAIIAIRSGHINLTLRRRDEAAGLAERVLSTSGLPESVYARAVILQVFIEVQKGNVDHAIKLISSGKQTYGPLLEFDIAFYTINQQERAKRANQ